MALMVTSCGTTWPTWRNIELRSRRREQQHRPIPKLRLLEECFTLRRQILFADFSDCSIDCRIAPNKAVSPRHVLRGASKIRVLVVGDVRDRDVDLLLAPALDREFSRAWNDDGD
jgi:hypothetical protein